MREIRMWLMGDDLLKPQMFNITNGELDGEITVKYTVFIFLIICNQKCDIQMEKGGEYKVQHFCFSLT